MSLKRQKKLSTCYEAQVAFVSRIFLNVQNLQKMPQNKTEVTKSWGGQIQAKPSYIKKENPSSKAVKIIFYLLLNSHTTVLFHKYFNNKVPPCATTFSNSSNWHQGYEVQNESRSLCKQHNFLNMFNNECK